MKIVQFSWLILFVVFNVVGCAGVRWPLSSADQSGPENQSESIRKLLQSQQKSDEAIAMGGESSLYPAKMAHEKTIPRSYDELKNPVGLQLSYAKFQEQLGNLTDARKSFQTVLDQEPKSAEALLGLARLDQLAERPDQAEAHLQQAMKVSGGSAEVVHSYGLFFADQQQYDQALSYLQQAVSADPKTKRYQYDYGVVLARAGQTDLALQNLTEAVGQPQAYYNLGYIAMKEQKRPDLATPYFREALRLKPDLEQAQYWLSQLEMRNPIRTVSAEQSQQIPVITPAITPSQHNRVPNGSKIQTMGAVEHITPQDKWSASQAEQWQNQEPLE